MDITAIRSLIARRIVPRLTHDATSLRVLAAVREQVFRCE